MQYLTYGVRTIFKFYVFLFYWNFIYTDTHTPTSHNIQVRWIIMIISLQWHLPWSRIYISGSKWRLSSWHWHFWNSKTGKASLSMWALLTRAKVWCLIDWVRAFPEQQGLLDVFGTQVVRTYQKWSKEGKPMKCWQGHGQPRMTDAGGRASSSSLIPQKSYWSRNCWKGSFWLWKEGVRTNSACQLAVRVAV